MKKIIKLIKRCKLKKKARQSLPTYDVCVTRKSMKGKNVIEKLGEFNRRQKFVKLNVFRLVYWLSNSTALSGNVYTLLQEVDLLRV